eukprot:c19555_g1_i1 orf=1-225(-)
MATVTTHSHSLHNAHVFLMTTHARASRSRFRGRRQIGGDSLLEHSVEAAALSSKIIATGTLPIFKFMTEVCILDH